MIKLLFRKEGKILFISGANLLVLNFLMVHQISAGLRHPEIATIIFVLSYFTGISYGYFISKNIRIETIKKLVPIIIIAQSILVITIHPISRILFESLNKSFSYDTSNFLTYCIIFLLLFFSGTILYAIFLPKFVIDSTAKLKQLYSAEILGSISALLVIIPLISVSFHILIASYFVLLLYLAWLIKLGKKSLIFVFIWTGCFIISYQSLDEISTTYFYKLKYGNDYIDKVTYTKDSPYQRIDVVKLLDNEKILSLNGRRQFGKGSHFNYSYFVAEYPSEFFGKPNVCVLGCGSMSTVGRINNRANKFTIVDIDKEVFNTSKIYFSKYNKLDSLKNYSFTEDDAKHFIANTTKKFNLILHDIPPAHTRQIALTYTKQFFELIKKKLDDDGIFSIASLSPIKSNYGRRMLATLIDVFPNSFAISYNNDIYFYGCNADFKIPKKTALYQAIKYNKIVGSKVYFRNELLDMVSGSTVITINNLGDLIFE